MMPKKILPPIFISQYDFSDPNDYFLSLQEIFLNITWVWKWPKTGPKLAKFGPAISQQPIFRFSWDFTHNTRLTWARWHEASFVNSSCLLDRISKKPDISRPNIQILAITGMQKKVTLGPSLWLDSVFWRLSTRQEIGDLQWPILSYLW